MSSDLFIIIKVSHSITDGTLSTLGTSIKKWILLIFFLNIHFRTSSDLFIVIKVSHSSS